MIFTNCPSKWLQYIRGIAPTTNIMNKKILVTVALAAVILWFAGHARAQGEPSIRGWDPLPDSLFQIWGLEGDQMRRLRVIEEDHNAERAEIMKDASLTDQARVQRLEQLAIERRKEIKAVLQVKQFEDWERRSRTTGLK